MELALGISLCTVLVAITFTDLERRLIPNRVVLAGALVGIAIAAVADPASLGERGLAAVTAGGAMLAVALAHPRGLGMGDVKLVAMMGLYLGRAIAPALLVAFGLGTVAGLTVIARRGLRARRDAIPFGPFLALGGVIGLWVGDELVDWYLGGLLSSPDDG